ncbi:MAG: methylmalonyl Co-A mutase-associated GTPase MeaB [Planctomycetes bacterium]|nr:methylmalonyl Co-A mutase-associated GTPase MeaB [Planctomycetota bacterium]
MVENLVERMQAGDRRALARLMTLAENESPEVPRIFAALRRAPGRAHRLGVTGPPGAGKSTLVGRLIEALRAAGETVGVLAVDPSSPLSGGALLGDRLRMPVLDDPGVFVRSMASRGTPGGLARHSLDLADLLDAFGRDWILIETVGTGQGELEILNEADTTLVVLHPGTGDTVQALKAGLFEVGDLFAVNKADQIGADSLKAELEWAFRLREDRAAPPVRMTSARENRGVGELLVEVRRIRAAREADGQLGAQRQARLARRLRREVELEFADRLAGDPDWTGLLENLARRVMDLEIDRYAARAELIRRLGKTKGATEA